MGLRRVGIYVRENWKIGGVVEGGWLYPVQVAYIIKWGGCPSITP